MAWPSVSFKRMDPVHDKLDLAVLFETPEAKHQ